MRNLSPIALVLGNLLPIAGVLMWNWDVASIVVFYWTENLVIGLYNVVKLLHTGLTQKGTSTFGVLFTTLFFLVHYGGFCLGHGFFIVELFDIQLSNPDSLAESTDVGLLAQIQHYLTAVAPTIWVWGVVALFFSHGVSLFANYFGLASPSGEGEYKRTTLNKLMSAPYQRIVLLHVAVLFGAIGIEELGSPLPLLLLLVGLKIAIDLKLHLSEHDLAWSDLFSKNDSRS